MWVPSAQKDDGIFVVCGRVQGKVYPDSILYEDITWDAPHAYDEGGLNSAACVAAQYAAGLPTKHVMLQCL
jgi:hypothetical protein